MLPFIVGVKTTRRGIYGIYKEPHGTRQGEVIYREIVDFRKTVNLVVIVARRGSRGKILKSYVVKTGRAVSGGRPIPEIRELESRTVAFPSGPCEVGGAQRAGSR